MQSSMKVMIAIAVVIGAGLAAAIGLVVVMRKPPDESGEVRLLIAVKDQFGKERSDFGPGEPVIIEVWLVNNKKVAVTYEGSSCLWVPGVENAEGLAMVSSYCPGDHIQMQIGPGSHPQIGSIYWDQTCQAECDPNDWGRPVPAGEYVATGKTAGTVAGKALRVETPLTIG
jgi:hypothetical protein